LLSWVVLASDNSKEENAVLKVGVAGSYNRTVPVGKGLVVTLVEAVGDVLVRKLTFLSLLKLFVESESSWH